MVIELMLAGALMADSWSPSPELVAANEARRPDFAFSDKDMRPFELPSVLGPEAARLSSRDWPQRREEIVELLRREMFGRVPANMTTDIAVSEPTPAAGLDATHQTITVTVSNGPLKPDAAQVRFQAHVFVPTKTRAPAPAFILIDHREQTDETPLEGEESKGFWPVADLIARGYATAAFHCDPVAPDRKDAHDEGVHSLFPELGADGWSTLAAWAWAAARVLDGLEKIEDVDATQVGVIGHSRGGKTALWAAASDERFAIAVSNESGCGGAALSRRRVGETVARINQVFPYWFNDHFKAYNDREDDLPFDQHHVIGAIAPRAVYVGSADQDLWADPAGEYAALVAANPAFALFGDAALPEAMPALGEQRLSGRRGYHVRPGTHNLTREDWHHVLDFADTQFQLGR